MNSINTTQDRRARLGASYDADAAPVQINRRYSRFVKSLRIILPLIAIGIITTMFLGAEGDKPALPVQKIETPTYGSDMPQIEKNELVAPNFESETKDGKKYKITAERAVQELRQPDLILLESPRGTLEASDNPITMRARDGTYNQKTQFITLNENVEIGQEGKGKILLKTLEADLSRGEMTSPHAVKGIGTFGTLDAYSLRVTNEGQTIIFAGPIKIELKEGFETWFD